MNRTEPPWITGWMLKHFMGLISSERCALFEELLRPKNES
jgi:hypothetical protein